MASPRNAAKTKPETTPKRSARGKPTARDGKYLDTVVEVGASIDFPSGESLRITRIEGDSITVEKLP